MNKNEIIREAAKKDLLISLNNCHTVLIKWQSGRATNTGRTDYLSITGISEKGYLLHLEYVFCKSFGYRLSKNNEIIMSGCGFSKTHEIFYALSGLLGRDYRNQDQNIKPQLLYS